MSAVRLFLLLAAALVIGLPVPVLAVENSRELAKYCEAAVAGVEGSADEIEIPNIRNRFSAPSNAPRPWLRTEAIG